MGNASSAEGKDGGADAGAAGAGTGRGRKKRSSSISRMFTSKN